MLTNLENTNENPQLEKIIADSKNEIHIQTEKKSGRGRPRKDGSSPSQKTVNKEAFVNPVPVMQPMSKDTYKGILGGALDMLNLYLNKITKTEHFTLTKEEREMICEMGGATLSDFMPAVNPIYINAIGFAACIGGVYGMRYNAYAEEMKTKQKEKSQNAVVVSEDKK